MVKEYNVVIKMRVATYASDIGLKMFVDDVANAAMKACISDAAFICEHKPQIEVTYDPRT